MIPLKNTTSVFLLAVVCFALLPGARAVSPAPDGGYPGFNTAEGDQALFLLFGGFGNSAFGWRSSFSAVGANFNTSVGAGTLVLNTADENTAVGAAALLLNTTGGLNTAVGTSALSHNDTGDSNTAVGAFALSNNASGAISNNAIGRGALVGNTSGSFNEALGVNALGGSTTSNQNVAIGDDALFVYTGPGTIAGGNTAVGGGALSALVTGTLNTALGFAAGSADTGGETNNIYIGDAGSPGDTNIIAIGNLSATGTDYTECFIGSASTTVIMPGIVPGVMTNNQDVGVDANGALGTFTSSARFKENIKPMDKASEAIFALKPVTFRYKKEFDATGAQQLGLIAEDVAKVNPTCVALDRDGKPISVNYRPLTAMLLNEFLKEHKAFVEEQHTVQEQGATIARLEQQIEALNAGLQKVSAQLELNKPAPQTVLNNR
jgi:hypothetical protein